MIQLNNGGHSICRGLSLDRAELARTNHPFSSIISNWTKFFITLGLILPLASFGALAPSRGALWGSAILIVMGSMIAKYWLDWRKELMASD